MQVYRNAIFAGGGCRCFWQLGFWEGAKAQGLHLGDQVRFIGAVSAGAAMAAAAVLDRADVFVERFAEMTTRNPSNVHWWNYGAANKAPVLPHVRMYEEAMQLLLIEQDLTVFTKTRLAVLMARTPWWLGGQVGTALALLLAGLEELLIDSSHPRWPVRFGVRRTVGWAHQCTRVDELVDLVLASSCLPPLIPRRTPHYATMLDGGLINSVPVELAKDEPGRTLVLLSAPQTRALPIHPGRTYVQPSRSIPINRFDYADPEGVRATYELGREDGERFALQLQAV